MKSIKYIIFLIISCLFNQAQANNKFIELGYGLGIIEDETIRSMDLQLTFESKKKLFHLLRGDVSYGFGLRATNYYAERFQASDQKSEYLENINVTSINAFGQIHYTLGNFQLGFNLDLIGINLGSDYKIEGSDKRVKSENFNLFLFAENDMGSLNSHLYAKYRFKTFFTKMGLSHSLLTLEDKGLNGNDNRQRFFDSIFINFGIQI